MSAIIGWIAEHGTIIFGVLWGLCEALAAIPFVKANSVFQLIYNWVKKEKTVRIVTPPSPPSPPPSQL